MSCCVRKCRSRSGSGTSVRFFGLPSEEDNDGNWSYRKALQRQLWLEAINRNILPRNPMVCSRHFVSGEASNLLCYPDFVPSKNLGYDEPTTSTLRPPLQALQPPPKSTNAFLNSVRLKRNAHIKGTMTESSFDAVMAKASEAGLLTISTNPPSSVPPENSEGPKEGDEADDGPGEVTTLKMLLLRCLDSDLDFIECCQHVGLIAPNQQCTCETQMIVSLASDALDGGEWKCPSCHTTRGIREGTWLEDVRTIKLKDVVIGLYCWSRNYPEQLCQHEMDLREVSYVPFLYKKCQQLTTEFINNEISNIGRPGEVVEIEQFQTQAGLHVVGGVERNNYKNVFFRVLPENWNRDDLVTAIVDQISYGSILHTKDTVLLDILAPDGIKYLEKYWGLKMDLRSNCESPLVTSLWALFERLIAEKDYTQNNLLEFLMRRRMESTRDPFLFLLEVITSLHPPCIAAS
ncbi:hypothetical protein GE061_007697 [Apolygus lucorum]|uniref:THAP-type domain-containing protein n=1 Tax=Apolygus lucorum TaxID=248454 RepID=A0A8S9WNZ5_APOLU|nr:hypothetical protein GE061_007697 [Apolygus lucorum]